MTGTIVSHYEVLERLGRGGMGVVYKAKDLRLGRFAALKFLSPHIIAGDELVQRFILEAQAASALEHPNICTIYEFDETDEGQMFIAMAFYEGETVQKKVSNGPLAVEEALDIGIQAARGLAKAHESGIVHRDINPSNLIVADGVVKILDFGAAIVRGAARVTKSGMTLGTLPYMSPEQVRGERQVDPRTDIWSLGAVLYEMFTGRLPFCEEYDQSLIYCILGEDPEPLQSLREELPAELDRIVRVKMLAKEPAERYASMPALLLDLKRLEQNWNDPVQTQVRQQTGRRFSTGPRTWRPQFAVRPRAWAAIGASLAAALIAVALFLFPVRVRLLSLACRVAPSALAACEIPNFRHISVLPFVSASSDPQDAVLARGLSANLLQQLQRLERSDNTICVHGARGGLPEFGVNLLVAGTLDRRTDQLHLTVSLLNASSSVTLRSDEVEAPTNDVALLKLLEDGTVLRLAQLFHTELPAERLASVTAGGTAIPSAFLAYVRGLGYLQSNEVKEAISTLEYALQQDSYYALAHNAMGDAQWRQFNLTHDSAWRDQAGESYQQAIAQRDQLPDAHIGLGRIDTSLGRRDDAVKQFRRALELDPLSTSARLELAGVYQSARMLDEAKSAYDAEIQLRPNCWFKRHMLGVFYWRNGCYDQAEKQFRRVIELSPDNGRAYTNLSAVYLHSDRLQEAEAALRRSIEIEPSAPAYLNLGNVYFRQHRYAESAAMVDQAIKLGANNYQVWGNRAEAYHMVPQLRDRAPALFHRAIELVKIELSKDRFNAEAWAMLANHHARLRQPDEAREAIETALQLAPENINVLFRGSLVFEMIGERDRALELLRKALVGGYSREEIQQSEPLNDLRNTPEYRKLEQNLASSQAPSGCPVSD